MGDLNKTTYFYRKKFKRKKEQFNRPLPLPDYFAPMIGDKRDVLIAEVGAGPVNTIGNLWPDTKVTILASDVMWPEYAKFWATCGCKPIVPVTYEDFEHLSYPDNSFDIVHCVNALDHTKDVNQALRELERVCKPGGWMYLRHAPDQKARYGGMHAWNCSEAGFDNGQELVPFEGFDVHLENDLIVAIRQK